MKKFYFLIFFSLLFISCNLFSPKMPERNGVYYQPQRGEFQQLTRFTGKPESSDYLKIFDVDDQPTFIFWEPFIKINLVILSNIQTRILYDFSYSTSRDNMITVSINEKLPTGFYCFTQGDPFEAPTMLKNWCFSIEMAQQRSRLEDDIEIELDPYSIGVFVIDNREFVELFFTDIDDTFLRRDFYTLSTSYPVISVRANYINPSNFNLYHLRPAIGISFSRFGEGQISSVDNDCIAHAAGIVPGDIIVNVNGINTQSDSYREVHAILKGELSFNEVTFLKVTRQAMIHDFSVIADCYILDDVPFTSKIQSNYYVFYPTIPLQQGGFFCFSEDKNIGYCFSVMP